MSLLQWQRLRRQSLNRCLIAFAVCSNQNETSEISLAIDGDRSRTSMISWARLAVYSTNPTGAFWAVEPMFCIRRKAMNIGIRKK